VPPDGGQGRVAEGGPDGPSAERRSGIGFAPGVERPGVERAGAEIAGAELGADEVATSPSATAADGVGLDLVREKWGAVHEALRAHSLLRTALAAGEPLAVEGGRLVLGFWPGAQYQRRSVTDAPGRERLEEALASVLGARLRVEAVEREGSPPPPADGEGGRGSAGASGRTGDRLTAAETEAVRQSPLTKLVEQELGGTIVGMRREE
jgi:hypothetical protein